MAQFFGMCFRASGGRGGDPGHTAVHLRVASCNHSFLPLGRGTCGKIPDAAVNAFLAEFCYTKRAYMLEEPQAQKPCTQIPTRRAHKAAATVAESDSDEASKDASLEEEEESDFNPSEESD
eukprot:384934-Pelagomonas_calceolata.AAC.1